MGLSSVTRKQQLLRPPVPSRLVGLGPVSYRECSMLSIDQNRELNQKDLAFSSPCCLRLVWCVLMESFGLTALRERRLTQAVRAPLTHHLRRRFRAHCRDCQMAVVSPSGQQGPFELEDAVHQAEWNYEQLCTYLGSPEEMMARLGLLEGQGQGQGQNVEEVPSTAMPAAPAREPITAAVEG